MNILLDHVVKTFMLVFEFGFWDTGGLLKGYMEYASWVVLRHVDVLWDMAKHELSTIMTFAYGHPRLILHGSTPIVRAFVY